MSNKIGVGLIGCGSIARLKHLPAISANSDRAQLIAVSDTFYESAQALVTEHGLNAVVYRNYHDLLADDRIDAVHICTPNDTHALIAIESLHAGKHVLCEKPMASTVSEAEEMLHTAQSVGKKLTISYQNRFREDSQAVWTACRKGLLGEIYFAKAHALRRKSVPTWGSFLDGKHHRGGPLMDLGSHSLDLALWFMDNYDVESVTGSVFHKLADCPEGNVFGIWNPDDFTVEDSAFGFIRMRNGATIYLESAWAINMLHPREAMTTLCGTRGGAEQIQGEFGPGSFDYAINLPALNRLMTVRPDPPHRYSKRIPARANEVMNEAPILEFRTWFSALQNDSEVIVRPEQALVVMKILEAIYESAEQGKTIYF